MKLNPKSRLLLSLICGVLGAWSIKSLATAQPAGISLVNVVNFYSGLPHQTRAIALLQRQINQLAPELLQDDALFTNVWRNGETLSGHIDILNTIALGDRTGTDPLDLALAQISRDPGTAVEVELLPGPGVENPEAAIVSVVLSDLLDDSVSGQRYRFDMRRQDATWEIVRAGLQVRCQSGRGPQTWSGGNCV